MSEYEADWEKCCREFKEKLIEENKVLIESRDELLAFLNQTVGVIDKHLKKEKWFDNIWMDELGEVIQKAKDLKEKETK